MVVSLHVVREVKEAGIKTQNILWFPRLHYLPLLQRLNNGSNYGTHCCTSMASTVMVCLPWLPNLICESPRMTDAGFVCTHLRCLKLHHFKMVEDMGLKIMGLRSPSMAWPPC
jgi:hypothetical protein